MSHIHGLSYLLRRGTSQTEKIFWTCWLIASSAILFSLIFLTTKKLFSRETFITNLEHEISVGEVPFPAVTICLDSLIYESIFEHENKSQSGNFTDDDLAAYQVLDLLYDQNFLPKNFSTHTLMKTLEKYSQDNSFNADFSIYFSGNRGVPFSRILTKWGLCFSFNLQPFQKLLNNETVSADFFYELPAWYKSSETQNFPWKLGSSASGIHICPLRQEFRNHKLSHKDGNMFQPFDLYRVIIHSPSELPYRAEDNFFHGRNDYVNIKVLTELQKIDKELEGWTPEQRNCYMEDEKKLKFFKIYTKANCEHECFSKIILQACGCVPFYMIRGPSERICGVWDRNCYSAIERDFDVNSKCHCLDNCEKLRYSSKWTLEESSELGILWVQHARFIVEAYAVQKVFGSIQAVCYFGGFLALAGGVSVFSLLQLLLDFLSILIPSKKRHSRVSEIPNLRSRNKLLILSDKLYHLKKDLMDFIRMSSVLGIRKLEGSYKAKVFWLAVLSVATAAFVHFINNLLENLPESHVSFVLDDRIWKANEIPFPAVSYCPELNKTLLEQHLDCRLRGFCENLNVSSININSLKAACVVCMYKFDELRNIENEHMIQLVLEDHKNNTFIDYLKIFFNSSLIDQQSFCMSDRTELKLRERIAHTSGFCYTINGQDNIFDEKNTARDFSDGNVVKANCHQKHKDSTRKEMKIALRYSRSLDTGWLPTNPPLINNHFSCLSDLGNIGIHSGSNFPTSYYQLQHGNSYSFTVNPIITRRDDSLRKIPPKLRDCYFEDERKLFYFRKYSHFNCKFECEALLMEESCLCTPFHYPRSLHVRICTNDARECLDRVRNAFSDKSSTSYKSCECLADCSSVTYTFDLMIGKISPKHLQNFTDTGDYAVESEVSISFQEESFIGYKRVLQSDRTILFSNIGAILWLFLGASALSIVEVIYFFTLRFFNNLWLDQDSATN